MFTGLFTLVACAATFGLIRLADHSNAEEGARHAHYFSDDEVRQSVVHSRQDLNLIAFLLMGIMITLAVGLGVIADRIH
jgi:hypothetical protein